MSGSRTAATISSTTTTPALHQRTSADHERQCPLNLTEDDFGNPCEGGIVFFRRWWEVKGRVRDVWKQALEPIARSVLLYKDDILEATEHKPPNLLYDCFIVGRTKKDAWPTIVCAAKQPKVRDIVAQAIQSNGAVPFGFRIGTRSRLPRKLGATGDWHIQTHQLDVPPVSFEAILATDSKLPRTGATIGGFAVLAGAVFGSTVAHPFITDATLNVTDSPEDELDDSDVDDFQYVDDLNDGYSDDHKVIHAFSGTTMPVHFNRSDLNPQKKPERREVRQADSATKGKEKAEMQWGYLLKTIDCEKGREIDFALIEPSEPTIQGWLPPAREDLLSRRLLVETTKDSPVLLSTSRGLIPGRLSATPSLRFVSTTLTPQYVFRITLERPAGIVTDSAVADAVESGDCGCWVLNESATILFGSVVAGFSDKKSVFMVDMNDILAALHQQFDVFPEFHIAMPNYGRKNTFNPLPKFVGRMMDKLHLAGKRNRQQTSGSTVQSENQAGEAFSLYLPQGQVTGDAIFWSALAAAAYNGADRVVEAILASRPDGLEEEELSSPLHAASSAPVAQDISPAASSTDATATNDDLKVDAAKNHPAVVRRLLNARRPLNPFTWYLVLSNALKNAVSVGNEAVVCEILKHHNGDGLEPVMRMAMEAANQKVLDLLALHEYNSSSHDKGYKRLLEEVLESHISSNAIRLVNVGIPVDAKLSRDCAVIYYTAVHGSVEATQILLSKGADANVKGGQHGFPLQAAAYEGHDLVVDLLLSDSKVDVNAEGGESGNAFQAALRRGHGKIAGKLLDAGFQTSPLLVNNEIYEASKEGKSSVVEALLTYPNVDLSIGSLYGNGLQAASVGGFVDIVQMLLAHGADVNAESGFYKTALQAASANGHEDAVKVLLSHGALINVQGGRHGSAMQAALDKGHGTIAQLLRRRSF